MNLNDTLAALFEDWRTAPWPDAGWQATEVLAVLRLFAAGGLLDFTDNRNGEPVQLEPWTPANRRYPEDRPLFRLVRYNARVHNTRGVYIEAATGEPLRGCELCEERFAAADAIEALTADAERLRDWKASAMTVLAGWDTVWEAAGRPGALGQSKHEATAAFVGEQEARLAAAEKVAEAADGLSTCLREGGNGEGWVIADFVGVLDAALAEWNAAKGKQQ